MVLQNVAMVSAAFSPSVEQVFDGAQRGRRNRIGVHRDVDRGGDGLGKDRLDVLPRRADQVVRLVDEDPVRPPRARAKREHLRQELREEPGTLLEVQRLRVHDHVGLELAQELEHLLRKRRCARIAIGDRMLERRVVAFRVEHAELQLLLRHALGERRGEGGLPDARGARDQHRADVRLEIELARRRRCPPARRASPAARCASRRRQSCA